MNHDAADLTNFCGTARLFPLPNLVLFPSVIQPLHIFEPRYRELLADALADDRLMALALLKPGWEQDYDKRPPIFPVVCLGRIFKEERLTNGRFNLLLHGLSRARILEEIHTDRAYRIARVQLIPECQDPAGKAARDLRDRLGEQMQRWLAPQQSALDQLNKLLGSGLSVGMLCDILAFALPFEVEHKQGLLEERDPGRRVDQLLGHLTTLVPPADTSKTTQRQFPPDFSAN
jgi:Lon protease-like protein